MAEELVRGYPAEDQKDMRVVLRDIMARFQDHPEELAGSGSGSQAGNHADDSGRQP